MGLFSPIWMTAKSEKKNKALQAVSRVSDQTVLKDIAINAPLKDVAMAACRRVNSERDLADIALAGNVYRKDIRVAAAKRITEQDLLYTIAKECPLKDAWGYAISKLGNLDLIDQLYQFHARKEDIDYYVGRAVDNYADVQSLYSFLKSGKYLPKMEKKLDLMEKSQLELLASDPSVDKKVRVASCEKIGHVRKIGCYRCICERCGEKTEHVFDSDSVCRYCGGKWVMEEEILMSEGLVKKHPSAIKRLYFMVYPDGDKEFQKQRIENLPNNVGQDVVKNQQGQFVYIDTGTTVT